MAKAVLAPGQGDQPVLGKLGENLLADRPVEGGAGVGVVLEEKGDVGDQRRRHETAHRAGGDDHHIDGAELRPHHHLALAAEHAVGEDFDPEAPFGAFRHHFGEHGGGDAVMGGFAQPDAQGDLGFRPGRCRTRQQRTGKGQPQQHDPEHIHGPVSSPAMVGLGCPNRHRPHRCARFPTSIADFAGAA